MYQLFSALKEAQTGEELATCYIIERFRPLLKKYARQLSYDCAETDLVISLIEKIQKMDLTEFRNCSDGAVVNYMVRFLTSKKIDIYRKKTASQIEECHIDAEQLPFVDDCISIEDQFCWKSLLLSVPEKYREVLIRRYLLGYSVAEIGTQMGLSRQSVNKINHKALHLLKERIC